MQKPARGVASSSRDCTLIAFITLRLHPFPIGQVKNKPRLYKETRLETTLNTLLCFELMQISSENQQIRTSRPSRNNEPKSKLHATG